MKKIAKEYGDALFMIACEENAKQEYKAALDCVTAQFRAQPSYLEMLACPVIPKRERQRAVRAVFADRIPAHLLSYLELLCERDRACCFFASAEQFSALFDASERVLTAQIKSAAQLTETEKARIKEMLSRRYGGKVRAEYSIDAGLLCGVLVEIDGKVLDGSLLRRLQKAKKEMEG